MQLALILLMLFHVYGDDGMIETIFGGPSYPIKRDQDPLMSAVKVDQADQPLQREEEALMEDVQDSKPVVEEKEEEEEVQEVDDVEPDNVTENAAEDDKDEEPIAAGMSEEMRRAFQIEYADEELLTELMLTAYEKVALENGREDGHLYPRDIYA